MIIAATPAIADAIEAYGYRRMTEELRRRGLCVNSKRLRRLMREHCLIGAMGRRGTP